jgi:hypothetical protein
MSQNGPKSDIAARAVPYAKGQTPIDKIGHWAKILELQSWPADPLATPATGPEEYIRHTPPVREDQ